MRPLRIAVIGTRGVPATYGGIERHVEEIGSRLAQRGHLVTVYAHTSHVDSDPAHEYRGMRVLPMGALGSKHLETFVHSGRATLDSLLRDYDVVHFHALGPGLFAPLSRFASRAAVVQTIHGRDDQRAKWNYFAKRVLRVGVWTSAWAPDRTVVVSHDLHRHYQEFYGRQSTVIHNGAPEPVFRPPVHIARRWGLNGGDYVLAVGRLVPEKDAAGLIRGFRRVETDARLVIVGTSSHSDDYAAKLQALAAQDDRVVLTGGLYGEVLEELLSNARVFAQPSLLEGLPLTLLEAAGYGLPVLASDIPPHLEVLASAGDQAEVFPAGDIDGLAQGLARLLDRYHGERAAQLAADVRSRFCWDRATDLLLQTYAAAIAERGRRGPQSPLRRDAAPAGSLL